MAVPSAPAGDEPVSAESLNYSREWSARIICDQFEIGKSFTVYAFLGEAPDDPEQWEEDPSSVGSHGFFVNRDPSRCENCQKQAGGRVEAFIHLSNTLIDLDDVNDPALDVDQIEPYLQQKGISIRIRTLEGDVINPTDLKTFSAEIISTPLREERGHHQLPILGEVERHFPILSPQP
ncbi:hypothetical protein FRC03_001636 [Tulasnella sp. 419]|nr:hypothetical protein FRC03_001636 [Tulasnella sp. 419]